MSIFSCFDDVIGVIIDNTAAKNDVEREGHRFHYSRRRVSSVVAFDLVEILFNWAVTARLRPRDWFLSFRQTWKLSYLVLQDSIKKTARLMSLDPSKFSTHSLRIGGASVLAAAGVPDYVIMTLGRWKSLAFLGYIRLASKVFSSALDVLSNPSLLTIPHLVRINTGLNSRLLSRVQ